MITLDQNQTEQWNLISTLQSLAWEKQHLQLIEALKPKFSKDGNQFCFLYGELPNDCVVGFGDTAAKAAADFYNNFHNEKAK